MAQMIITNLDILRQKSKPITWEEIARLDLKKRIQEALTTSWTPGFGLAAVQIGLPLQYAWYQFRRQQVELINPKIIEMSEPSLLIGEGCLSIPGKRIDTIRYKEIKIENDKKLYYVSGLEACIVQHEIDHMNGILMYARAKDPYPKLGRNDLCLCGSGKKYKKCCLK